MTLPDDEPRARITKAIRAIRVQIDLGEAVPSAGADALDDDANAFVALRLEAIRAGQIGGAAAAKQESVARAAERVHVALVLRHVRADESPIAVALVIRFNRLAILQKVDELVAQLEAERPGKIRTGRDGE